MVQLIGNPLTQANSFGICPLICVKEDLLRKSPNSLTRTFLNANIIRNSGTSLAGLVQLKRGKNLYTGLPQSI